MSWSRRSIGRQDAKGDLVSLTTQSMSPDGQDGDAVTFTGAVTPNASGPLALGVRIRAHHDAQLQPVEPNLVRWA